MMAGFGVASLGMTSFELQSMVESTVLRIVDCLFAGTLIALFAGVVSYFSRKQGSSWRFVVWFSALIALVVSPLLSGTIWAHGGNASPTRIHAAIILPGSWALYGFGLWAAIASLLLIRVGIGLWGLRVLRKTFVPVNSDGLDEGVRGTLNCGQRRAFLCTSDQVQVPAAVGLIDPVVVVPRWALDELSSDELKQVLLHEMAHLRRRDNWTNLLQQFIKAMFFFHPAVWWIEHRLSLEREMACDDAVLAQTASPRAYALCLKHIAEKSLLRRSLVLAQAVLGRVRQTSIRVKRILDPTHSRNSKRGWQTAFSLATLLTACGVIAANEPHLIAFQRAEPALQDVATLHVPAITPVSFKTAGAVTPASFLRSNPVRVLAASHRNSQSAKHFATVKKSDQLATAAKGNGALLHFADAHIVVVQHSHTMASEAVFVVLVNRGFSSGARQIYEIEVVHVTVVQPPNSFLSSEILYKEI